MQGTLWETWQDVHGTSVSKNHPALGAGIGLWLYQLAGIAEDSTPDALILRPLRETIGKEALRVFCDAVLY
eukprot:COSAG06_NODE_49114_length_327_cov_1.223684_1_plen_71_part_00